MSIDEKDVGLAITKEIVKENKPARMVVNGVSLFYNGVMAYNYTITKREIDSLKLHLKAVPCQHSYQALGCLDTLNKCSIQSNAVGVNILKHTTLAVVDIASLVMDTTKIINKK